MKFDISRVRNLLREFDFKSLFIEELGWDRCNNKLDIALDGVVFHLTAVAEKHGMVAFICPSLPDGSIPDYSLRRKIERQAAKSVHEHIIIYIDGNNTSQIWQWVKRETGKPTACREHAYHTNQPGDSLIQKLQAIVFSLEEEEALTIVEVSGRARAAFDVERITRRFYDRFKAEHDAFLKFIDGIPDEELKRWYASVMLNRLMFIYFIQKKGFLDKDENYLRNKLHQSKNHGKDRFYRNILCPLFFEGFAKKEKDRSKEINELLGTVPFLNGGLFLKHQIEELHGKHIQIPDSAFDKLFGFFDQYQWHLDERPLKRDNEINPDVLGYIFEKYINQKQMGAYYTKEDITEYISKNTVIPFLFDAARQECKIAFEGEQSIWQLLRSDPDRYIYPAVKRGVELPLPEEIARGIKDVSQRTGWNKPAPPEYALPTEIWREVIARRQRYEEVRGKMLNGEIRSINDLITYNLDIRQFAQDVIWNSEGPELLRAFYHAIEKVTVLDPTCGSGAFLFAALNILEPLYEACLERMQVFVNELDTVGAIHELPLQDKKYRSDKYGDFKKILKRVSEHPNLKYFIYKSIIVNNLYGVDIMEEAIEICKLRLFLKLVAQIDTVEDIEPLPDIDFNIRAGNTLVGFATIDELKKSMEGDWVRLESLPTIEEKAEDVDRLFKLFQRQQTELGGEVTPEDKQALRSRLRELEDELNRYLASEYGIDVSFICHSRKQSAPGILLQKDSGQAGMTNKGSVHDAYKKWLDSHKPFHWFTEFYGILKNGGFDVIIGNPPYVELSEVRDEYEIKGLNLMQTGNLYSLCVEKFTTLLNESGKCGVIMPISSVSTPRMLPLMHFIAENFATLYLSNFAVRPGKLFVGVDMNLTIMLGDSKKKGANNIWSTQYNRWSDNYRPFLFMNLSYVPTKLITTSSTIGKIGSGTAMSLVKKMFDFPPLSYYKHNMADADVIFCHSGGRYFRKCLREKLSNEYKELKLDRSISDSIICTMSSSFYYWLWIAFSDCYHVTKKDIDMIPIPESLIKDKSFKQLAKRLTSSLYENAETRIRNRADGTTQKEINFKVSLSKAIIDEIDRVLAQHYGFTDEELDFIINYDIKYRMGRDSEVE